MPNQLIPVFFHPRSQGKHHALVFFRISQTIDTGNRRYDNHVFSLNQSRCGTVPHLINLVINRRILRNICVRGRHIGLRLIIIIIRHKILNRIVRKKRLELAVKLCCKRLIVRYDERRLIQLRDNICHREGLAGAGYTEQRLTFLARFKAFYQPVDCFRLIPGWCIFRYQFKMVHGGLLSSNSIIMTS